MGSIAGRKEPVRCDEFKVVTDAIMYTETGEVKSIKSKTVVPQQAANSLGNFCPLMRVPASWLILPYKGNETSIREVLTLN